MDLVTCLKLGATASAGLFAGNAMYINCVEHPSRMQLDLVGNRLVWKESFYRAKRIQGKLVLLGAAAGAGVFYHDTESPVRNLWLVGSGLFLAIWPYTLLVMISDIKKNLQDDVIQSRGYNSFGETWVKNHIVRWNKQHGVRTLISLGTFGVFLYALSQK